MKLFARLLALGTPLTFLAGCANRSEFIPDGSTTTVGMPAELSDRERNHVSELDAALRREGYLPVRHGAGELELEFRISEGPINTSTTIELREGRKVLAEGRKVLAEGRGRGAGMPMIGRDKIAERSYQEAFGEFESALPGAAAARLPQAGADEDGLYVY
jgi:hypothetical protein